MTGSPPNTKPALDGGLFIGLMSGTSLDGVDAVVARFEPSFQVEFAQTYRLPETLVATLLRLSQSDSMVALDDIGRLDTQLGQCFANVVQQCIHDAGISADTVTAIGSHGQTLRHSPQGEHPFTMQLGDAHIIAEQCDIDTVADFRRRDVAAGGQGAPLVPAFHASLFSDSNEERAILNVGGIANLTLLHRDGHVSGFDTGPGNGLMDAWCLQHRGTRYDHNGAFAAAGRVHTVLLQRCLDDAWFALPPPKSTGRDQFHLQWLNTLLQGMDASPEDVQATLCMLTASTIATAIGQQMPNCQRVIVCGGGVHNPVLMRYLGDQLPTTAIDSSQTHGLDPNFVEAAAFAWLARETLAQRAGNLPAVTGAEGPRVLGVVYPK
jgi:anhydro-N-acetylmuramic acid kinase